MNYQVGDQVELINNQCGLQGVQGVITKVTPQQVKIRIDGQRLNVKCKKTYIGKLITKEQ